MFIYRPVSVDSFKEGSLRFHFTAGCWEREGGEPTVPKARRSARPVNKERRSLFFWKSNKLNLG